MYAKAPIQTEYHSNIQTESLSNTQKQNLKHEISSYVIGDIFRRDPKILLGESNLFIYDSKSHAVVLAPLFQGFLELLVLLDLLDDKALTATSLHDLNSILQQPQGFRGGLLRKEGTERWHLEDNSTLQKHNQILTALMQQMGFVNAKSIDAEMIVDHCIIFGARTERMERRIVDTLAYLKKNLKVHGHVFLLGSNRKLVHEEIEHLKDKIEKLEASEKTYWSGVFKEPELSTEANAFMCLWRCIVPQDIRLLLVDKVIGIKSTRIGASHNEESGQRVTTEITIEDWMAFYQPGSPQAVFALAEQPYIRLLDQLRFTALTMGKKATADELVERIKNTTFYFVYPKPLSAPLLSVVLDEIGRNVYRTVDALKYFEGL